MKRLGLLMGVIVGGLLLTGCQSHNDVATSTKSKYEKTYGSEQKAYSKFQESTKNGSGDDSEQESEEVQSSSSSEKYYRDPVGTIMEKGEQVLHDKKFAFRIIELTDTYKKYHSELKQEKVTGSKDRGFSYTFRDTKDDSSLLFSVGINGQVQVFRGDEIVEQKDWMNWLR
ncbi:hypothetical protein [Lacticaseibacillus brantae]|uniref:Uncharacterized protein n=1 Tax=Lacticaseibacillus brantae DSM 23927 TaxID=1423727 RepID=A0A0R2AXF8_9LACO|nr:hypothetical protein [Lacticaseibacillus brantae]KRM72072.1 hypothetical protein FC34_GL001056 [Lacticaseibacillus brantae DSM 23927]